MNGADAEGPMQRGRFLCTGQYDFCFHNIVLLENKAINMHTKMCILIHSDLLTRVLNIL